MRVQLPPGRLHALLPAAAWPSRAQCSNPSCLHALLRTESRRELRGSIGRSGKRSFKKLFSGKLPPPSRCQPAVAPNLEQPGSHSALPTSVCDLQGSAVMMWRTYVPWMRNNAQMKSWLLGKLALFARPLCLTPDA